MQLHPRLFSKTYCVKPSKKRVLYLAPLFNLQNEVRKPDISIIIPTCNRKEILSRSLLHLNCQKYPPDKFEVIIVDDGSIDDTRNEIDKIKGSLYFQLHYIKQEKSGPSAARNKGIAQANADILLFTGDDILFSDNLLSEHLKLHRKHSNVAVLGFVDWSKKVKASDFMRFIAPDGFQFRYGNIKDKNNCGFRHFYTSNISLSKKWFEHDLFDEDFSHANLEDTELGYRLEKKGLKIILNEKAVGHHVHNIDLSYFCRRMKLTGKISPLLLQKHPELVSIFLPGGKRLVSPMYAVLRLLLPLTKINCKLYWQTLIITSYLEGIKESIKR